MTIPRDDHAIPTLALCGQSLPWQALPWKSLPWPSLRPLPHHGFVDPPAAMAIDRAARSVERPLQDRVWGRVSNRAEFWLPGKRVWAPAAERPQAARPL